MIGFKVMCRAFCAEHIDPAEATAAKGCALVYTVVGSPDHDNVGHVECGRRINEITAALSANKLTAEDNPGQVRIQSILLIWGWQHR